MSLTVLGTAANVFGVITPAKDFGEIIKGIADSIQEVKINEASTSYWDKTLQDRARDVYSFMARSKHAGTSDLQTRSLMKLFESLVVLRKEVIENNRHFYLAKFWASGDIRRKIKWVEMEMRQCQDLFLTDTQTIQLDMLLQLNREVRQIANREDRSYMVECTVIRWKVPGKTDCSDRIAFEYAYLVQKSHAFINELKMNSEHVQEQLLKFGHLFDFFGFDSLDIPEGSPISECEDAISTIIRACKVLRNREWDSASFIEWLTDIGRLSDLLSGVGLKKEARQIREFMCQNWVFLASRINAGPIHSHLARWLRDLAVSYSDERRKAEALSFNEQAIQIYQNLGESSLPQLARCLSDRSLYLVFLGRLEDALESVQESVGIWRRLVDKNLSLYGQDFVYSLRDQADTLLWLSKHDEALRYLQEALQWLSKLSSRYIQDHSVLYARLSWDLAISHRHLGDHEQAKEYGRLALNVFHALVRDRPLYYSYNLSRTLSYSSWLDHESALSVLNDSLILCRTVDTAFTVPQLAAILDRRADALNSNSRYVEALDSYDQAIGVRRRLLEDEEDHDSEHVKGLLQSFRLRASCLLSLHRRHDALSSLVAAQDAIVSHLKTVVGQGIETFIIRELEEERKLLVDCTSPDCIELISSLKNCKKVLTAIQGLKCAIRIGNITRSDFEKLSTIECQIHLALEKEDLALQSIQDAIDFYHSQIKQNESQLNREHLVSSLILQARCCVKTDRLDQALCSISDAVEHLCVDLEHKVGGGISRLHEIFDLYSNNSNRFLDEENCHQSLLRFLGTAIKVFQFTFMTSEVRTRATLAWLLDDKAHLLLQVKSYQEAISFSSESVSIYRRLTATDIKHQWNFAFCLNRLATCLLANGNGNAALTSVEEAINIQQHIEDREAKGARNLMHSISLRTEILYRLGQAANVRDSLSEMWPLQIPNPSKTETAES